MADGTPPERISRTLEQTAKKGAPRPSFCCGAYITHDSNGKPLKAPMRAQCNEDAMPGFGLCSGCSAREIELRRMLRDFAERKSDGQASEPSKRRRFGR